MWPESNETKPWTWVGTIMSHTYLLRSGHMLVFHAVKRSRDRSYKVKFSSSPTYWQSRRKFSLYSMCLCVNMSVVYMYKDVRMLLQYGYFGWEMYVFCVKHMYMFLKVYICMFVCDVFVYVCVWRHVYLFVCWQMYAHCMWKYMYMFICKVCMAYIYIHVCMWKCMCSMVWTYTCGTCSNSVSQPLQYIEDAKLLSEEVFSLFMEVVQYNNDNREVSSYSWVH